MSSHAHSNSDAIDVFGFWIYIMSDCVLFAALFAAYLTLHDNIYYGAILKPFISLPYVFVETMALLASSFTFGMSAFAVYKNDKTKVIFWLGVTFLLGLLFVTMEVKEFIHLYFEGLGWHTSGAMSAFFTLVGTHGFHVTMGLLWMIVSIVQLSIFGITPSMRRRLIYLGLFWAFLDIVWIFVFSVVYLMGVI